MTPWRRAWSRSMSTCSCGIMTRRSAKMSTIPGIVFINCFHFAGFLAQHIEIVAENLDRDLRAHAGKEMIDPMRDRLADADRRCRGFGRASPRMSFRISSRPRLDSRSSASISE